VFKITYCIAYESLNSH